MAKVAFYTLGCKVNQAETEALLVSLSRAGFEYVDFSEQADVYVINTCTVTKEADRKSRQMIRRAAKRKGDALVVATGCYAEISPQGIISIPGVDIVIPQHDKPNLINHILNNYKRVYEPRTTNSEPRIPRLHTRVFLKIQDGCDSFCSYCIVPFARGKPRSEPLEEIVKKARELVEEGVQEIVLTGVYLGKYGKDLPGGLGLVDLLKEILSIPKLGRIRLSSLEPEEVTSELITLIKSHSQVLKNLRMGRICRHLHIPMQSGDDTILKKMGRKYMVSHYEDIVTELNKKVPGIAITTDVMVGFPGETDEQFARTLDLVERLELAKLHVFKYSPRKGTAAVSFPDQVSGDIKNRRSDMLTKVNEALVKKFREKFIGQTLEVLVEQKVNGKLTGLTDNYLRVHFNGADELIGKLVDIPLAK